MGRPVAVSEAPLHSACSTRVWKLSKGCAPITRCPLTKNVGVPFTPRRAASFSSAGQGRLGRGRGHDTCGSGPRRGRGPPRGPRGTPDRARLGVGDERVVVRPELALLARGDRGAGGGAGALVDRERIVLPHHAHLPAVLLEELRHRSLGALAERALEVREHHGRSRGRRPGLARQLDAPTATSSTRVESAASASCVPFPSHPQSPWHGSEGHPEVEAARGPTVRGLAGAALVRGGGDGPVGPPGSAAPLSGARPQAAVSARATSSGAAENVFHFMASFLLGASIQRTSPSCGSRRRLQVTSTPVGIRTRPFHLGAHIGRRRGGRRRSDASAAAAARSTVTDRGSATTRSRPFVGSRTASAISTAAAAAGTNAHVTRARCPPRAPLAAGPRRARRRRGAVSAPRRTRRAGREDASFPAQPRDLPRAVARSRPRAPRRGRRPARRAAPSIPGTSEPLHVAGAHGLSPSSASRRTLPRAVDLDLHLGQREPHHRGDLLVREPVVEAQEEHGASVLREAPERALHHLGRLAPEQLGLRRSPVRDLGRRAARGALGHQHAPAPAGSPALLQRRTLRARCRRARGDPILVPEGVEAPEGPDEGLLRGVGRGGPVAEQVAEEPLDRRRVGRVEGRERGLVPPQRPPRHARLVDRRKLCGGRKPSIRDPGHAVLWPVGNGSYKRRGGIARAWTRVYGARRSEVPFMRPRWRPEGTMKTWCGLVLLACRVRLRRDGQGLSRPRRHLAAPRRDRCELDPHDRPAPAPRSRGPRLAGAGRARRRGARSQRSRGRTRPPAGGRGGEARRPRQARGRRSIARRRVHARDRDRLRRARRDALALPAGHRTPPLRRRPGIAALQPAHPRAPAEGAPPWRSDESMRREDDLYRTTVFVDHNVGSRHAGAAGAASSSTSGAIDRARPPAAPPWRPRRSTRFLAPRSISARAKPLLVRQLPADVYTAASPGAWGSPASP